VVRDGDNNYFFLSLAINKTERKSADDERAVWRFDKWTYPRKVRQNICRAENFADELIA
jgi:hypothetical protein